MNNGLITVQTLKKNWEKRKYDEGTGKYCYGEKVDVTDVELEYVASMVKHSKTQYLCAKRSANLKIGEWDTFQYIKLAQAEGRDYEAIHSAYENDKTSPDLKDIEKDGEEQFFVVLEIDNREGSIVCISYRDYTFITKRTRAQLGASKNANQTGENECEEKE